jgi:ElaB/YqjD/DUF883 family membrane-anchored ribosome-binding protein
MAQATHSGSAGSNFGTSSGNGGSTAEMQDKVQDIKQNLQDLGTGARQMASDQLQQFKTSASVDIEQGRTRALDMERTLESQIRDQPLRSVLVAAGIGLVLGVLWNRH